MTLLEILIVVSIIAILVALATLSVTSSSNQTLRTESQNLADSIELFQLLASLRNRPTGIAFAENQYLPMELQSQLEKRSWQTTSNNKFRQPIALSGPNVLRLWINQSEVPLAARLPDQPQVVLMPHGLLPDFSVSLSNQGPNNSYRIEVNDNGLSMQLLTPSRQ